MKRGYKAEVKRAVVEGGKETRRVVFFDDFIGGWKFAGSDTCEVRNEEGKLVFDPKGQTQKQFGLVCKGGPFDISLGVLLEVCMEKGESGTIFVILSKRRDVSFTDIPPIRWIYHG